MHLKGIFVMKYLFIQISLCTVSFFLFRGKNKHNHDFDDKIMTTYFGNEL